MKVSVIIPLYNAEKYIAACLESVLNQTFKDFEVIVVDDCSTDNSCAIVETYLEKFSGRLKIIYLPQNTGNASIPRNEGLKFSRGEYIFFMDNDDLLINNALGTFYNLAKNFRADVVYSERGFILNGNNLTAANWDKKFSPIDKPTLESDNISSRIENFLQTNYGWAPWTKFLRRDFLIASFKIIFLAKNFLRIPNPLYIYRSVENSWSRIKREPADEIKFWLSPLVKGVDYLDDFMDGMEFFALNPNYRFDVINFFVRMQVAGMLGALKNLTRYELYEIIHSEFGDKHASLIAYLFVVMNFYRDKFLEVR